MSQVFLSLCLFFELFFLIFAVAACSFLFSALRSCELMYCCGIFVYKMCRVLIFITLEPISFVSGDFICLMEFLVTVSVLYD